MWPRRTEGKKRKKKNRVLSSAVVNCRWWSSIVSSSLVVSCLRTAEFDGEKDASRRVKWLFVVLVMGGAPTRHSGFVQYSEPNRRTGGDASKFHNGHGLRWVHGNRTIICKAKEGLVSFFVFLECHARKVGSGTARRNIQISLLEKKQYRTNIQNGPKKTMKTMRMESPENACAWSGWLVSPYQIMPVLSSLPVVKCPPCVSCRSVPGLRPRAVCALRRNRKRRKEKRKRSQCSLCSLCSPIGVLAASRAYSCTRPLRILTSSPGLKAGRPM